MHVYIHLAARNYTIAVRKFSTTFFSASLDPGQFYFQQVDKLIVFQCLINLTVKMRLGLEPFMAGFGTVPFTSLS
jgi:hypothetical protein